MRLTRRELLAAGAVGALGAAGVYELVDQLTDTPARTTGVVLPPEQHLLLGQEVVRDNGVEVIVPPLHHQLVTARVVLGKKGDLAAAQAALEKALADLETRYEPSPAGLGVTVAWGLPYFRRFVPQLAERHIPLDRRATGAQGKPVRALIDAIRFPSDPDDTILEDNEVAVLLRSDDQAHIADGAHAIFNELELFEPTSIRKGFAGGGFSGETSLPKRMAMEAKVPGAELIPDTSELFLGFTSTQRHGLGPARIANLETLGYTEPGYFRQGTTMHVSHIAEDLENWYLNFNFRERVDTTFRPNLPVREGTQTVPQPPARAANERQVGRDYRRYGAIGHSSSIQPASRLDRAVIAEDGTVYAKGTAVPHRADFNTLDNPFFWTADPDRDKLDKAPAAGVHFVVFNPTSDDFHRTRLAMDGVLPDGTKLEFAPGDRGQGFNSILHTTHRQNFIVPPRRYRSFPLVGL